MRLKAWGDQPWGMRGRGALDPAVRHLVDAGLVEGSVLAVAPGRAWPLRQALRAQVVHPRDLARVQRAFRTVLDLGGLADAVTPAQRERHVRLLADVVEPAGFLHVVVPSERDAAGRVRPGVRVADLLRVFGKGWALLSLHETEAASSVGGPRHAWLATFVHGLARRRRTSSPIRSFTDLGVFGSLDLGATPDRPPWGP